jgi:hypothetical protein
MGGDKSKFATFIKKGVDATIKKASDVTKSVSDSVKESINNTNSGVDKYKDGQTKPENKDITNNLLYNKELYDIGEITDYGDLNNRAVSDILTNVFDGNLFDAGVSAISLKNINSTWNLARRTVTDTDRYGFLYNTSISLENKGDGGDKVEKLYDFIDSMEDPTILGFSLKISDDSVLMGTTTDAIRGSNPEVNSAPAVDVDNTTGKSSGVDDLGNYLDVYSTPKAKEFLNNFRTDIKKIFETPSTLDAKDLLSKNLKNHYVKSISNLDKLDNMFVEYNAANPQALDLTLHEDVRLFTTNLKYMYNNFVYNYNLGVRVVPENLLKFDLYIKISEKRTFTLDVDDQNMINNHTPTIIYRLSGCEFIFDKSIISGNSVDMMTNNSEGTDSYNELKISIKYKKVNRIFKKPYSYGKEDWKIDDSMVDFTDGIKTDAEIIQNLQQAKYKPALSNAVLTTQSLRTKLANLTNNPLGKNANTVAGKFASTLGNNAIKSGAQFVTDQATKLKNAAQSEIGNSALFKNPITNNIKNLLKANITLSTKDLKTMLPSNRIPDTYDDIRSDLKGVVNNFIPSKGYDNFYNDKKDVPPTIISPYVVKIDNETNISKSIKYGDKIINEFGVYNSVTEYEKDITEYEKELIGKERKLDSSVTNYVKKLEEYKKELVGKERKLDVYTPGDTVYKQEDITEYRDNIGLDMWQGVNVDITETGENDKLETWQGIKQDITDYKPNVNQLPKEDLSNGNKVVGVLPKEDITDYKPNTNKLPKEDLSNGNKSKGVFSIVDITVYPKNKALPNIKENVNTGKKITEMILPKENLNNGIITYNKLPKEDLSK